MSFTILSSRFLVVHSCLYICLGSSRPWIKSACIGTGNNSIRPLQSYGSYDQTAACRYVPDCATVSHVRTWSYMSIPFYHSQGRNKARATAELHTKPSTRIKTGFCEEEAVVKAFLHHTLVRATANGFVSSTWCLVKPLGIPVSQRRQKRERLVSEYSEEWSRVRTHSNFFPFQIPDVQTALASCCNPLLSPHGLLKLLIETSIYFPFTSGFS